MRNLYGGISLVIVALLVSILALSDESPTPTTSTSSLSLREKHVGALMGTDDRTVIEASIRNSDEVSGRMAQLGVSHPTQVVRGAMFSGQVTESDLMRYYDAHRDRFDGRSLDQSRDTIDILIRVERTRGELDALRFP
jgi:hypothetical protein